MPYRQFLNENTQNQVKIAPLKQTIAQKCPSSLKDKNVQGHKRTLSTAVPISQF